MDGSSVIAWIEQIGASFYHSGRMEVVDIDQLKIGWELVKRRVMAKRSGKERNPRICVVIDGYKEQQEAGVENFLKALELGE